MEKLPNPEIRKHKAAAQRLKPILHVGKSGLTESFLKSVEEAFQHHELLKIKFSDHKEERHALAPQLAEKTNSHLITLLGNVVVLFRAKAEVPTPQASE
ncbi:MAG TPA: YhbY family RNA-binding protein [Candidatus Saccharimonadales bacterium]|nr:YhbY family RNA-binding protein [Candidatus Saccharimonadales bacterium]